MIFSSADILSILGADAVIRQEAKLSTVDSKPGLGVDEYVYIYIDRYPVIEDFEATWKIWVINGGSDFLDVVLNVMTARLPKFDFNGKHSFTSMSSSPLTPEAPVYEIVANDGALADCIGAWSGDETDIELLESLKEIRLLTS